MIMRIDPSQLRAFIADSGLVNAKDLKAAESESVKTNKGLDDALLSKGILTEEQLSKLKAYILGIPFVNLENQKIDKEILSIIPEPIARKYNIVAYRKKGRILEVAMLNPEDLQTIEFIKKKSNLRILPRLTSSGSIKSILSQYQKSLEAEFKEIIGKESQEADIETIQEKIGEVSVESLEKVAQDLPVIKVVDTLLRHAIIQRASDIHVEPAEMEVVIRYRIDGLLHDAMVLPKQIYDGIVARIKVLSNLKLDEHRLPQDGRFKIETKDYKVSFRVSIIPVHDGEKIVMRLLPEESHGFTLEALGFKGLALERIHHAINKPYGMILSTGPTGSGKTTTLYTVLDILNKPQVNISTVEDPIEYRMPRINQTQINSQIGLTFAKGLRALVRQDPDIIMVGEIRDNETASLAINAALTGHLVLSTLHTNSAAGALPRLSQMGVEEFLVSSTTNVIIAQRLVRKLCPEARQEYHLSEEDVKNLSEYFNLDKILGILREEKVIGPKAEWDEIPFYRPGKTQDCPDGYKGRVGIYEVLEITETIKEMIIKKASEEEIENRAREEGMVTMIEDGFITAARGITSLEEVLRVTKE